jgi:acyl carrier protein
VALPLDRARLRSLAGAGALPPILSGLVRGAARRHGAHGVTFAHRLRAAADDRARRKLVTEMVREHAASVLGLGSPGQVDLQRDFASLGFDSLAAVELRNRLVATTGVTIPATAVFDYPTCADLADFTLEALGAGAADTPMRDVERLEKVVMALAEDRSQRPAIADRLHALLSALGNDVGDGVVSTDLIDTLESASDDELLRYVDDQAPADV